MVLEFHQWLYFAWMFQKKIMQNDLRILTAMNYLAVSAKPNCLKKSRQSFI